MRSGSASSVFMLNSRRQFESPANTCAMYCNVSPLAPQYLRTCGKRRLTGVRGTQDGSWALTRIWTRSMWHTLQRAGSCL
jgi:hypothetical protein